MALEALGTYAVTEVVSAAAQTEINAQIAVFEALIGGNSKDDSFPDGDQISPQLKERLLLETAALKAAIDAAPTA